MKAIALYNLKGGVGKTTAAVHLAHLWSRGGKPTLVWDLDAQGAASFCFRVRPDEAGAPGRLLRDRAALWESIRGSDYPHLDVLPADLSVRKLEAALRSADDAEQALRPVLAELGTRYERIVLDCAPSLSTLAEAVFPAVDALVVPTIPTALSLRTLAALYKHVKPHRKRGLLVLPFFSMVDARKALHQRVRTFARAEGLGFLEAEIPYSAVVEGAAVRREPLTLKEGSAPAAAFARLADEIEARLAAPEAGPTLDRSRVQELAHELGRPRRKAP